METLLADCKSVGCSVIRPNIDKNGTQKETERLLMYSMIRLSKALTLFEVHNEVILVTTPAMWESITQVEGVLNSCFVCIKFSQDENHFTGGFHYVMHRQLLRTLDTDALIQVIKYPIEGSTCKPPRVDMSYDKFSEVGKTCWDRAFAETQFWTKRGLSNWEFVATYADHRLCHDSINPLTPELRIIGLREENKDFTKYINKGRIYDNALVSAQFFENYHYILFRYSPSTIFFTNYFLCAYTFLITGRS